MAKSTLLLLLAAFVAGSSGSSSVAQRRSGRIAFIREYDRGRDLVVMSPSGTSAHVVDNARVAVQDFAWSPDGRRLVFAAVGGGRDLNLYVVNADGTGLKRITRTIGNDEVPAWSPRGDKIAFEDEDDADRSIRVVNPDGSRLKRLTRGFDRGFEHPAWSDDGSKITFGQLGSGAIYVMHADGSHLHRVAGRSEVDTPQWSPGGQVAHFWRRQIWLVNSDGTGRTAAIKGGTKSDDPSFRWSPDGRTIAFAGRGTARHRDILLASAASGRVKRTLTNNDLTDTAPTWSPDGRALAFLRYQGGGRADVYVISADGTGERNLTKSTQAEFAAAWSPR